MAIESEAVRMNPKMQHGPRKHRCTSAMQLLVTPTKLIIPDFIFYIKNNLMETACQNALADVNS